MFGRPRFEAGIVLDREKARAALAKVAAPLGKSVDEVAVGIVRIAAASMGNAMREITVERGLDPRTMTLLPFGGAGPLLAVLLADELEMNRIVVPLIAGNFSAYGLLGADVVRAVARTILVPLDEAGLAKASAALAELHAGLEESGPDAAATAQLDLRYRGQEHWLSIAAACDATMFLEEASEIASRYRKEYRSRYGGVMEAPVEILAVRAQRTKALPRLATVPRTKPPDSAKAQTCDAYSLAMGKVTTFALIDRDAVAEALPGPAIVTERTATLYVDAGWSVRAGNTGELVLTREAISLG
jgi:N-methylhydantoinase A